MEEILNILDKEKGNVSRAKIAQMLGMEEKRRVQRTRINKHQSLQRVYRELPIHRLMW